ncbi:hypothetical protein UlMin_013447 [Ulmus minor]
MAKHLERNGSFVGGNHPGFMCGLLHILDFHRWHIKKLLPRKKHARRRRLTGYESPEAILKNRGFGEVEVFMEAEAEPLLGADPNSPSRKSGKARIKSPRTWLHQTNPINHLEPSENLTTKEPKPLTLPQEYGDILEIFEVNKEFFLKILQDPDVSKNWLYGSKNSNVKLRLTKSRSFPLPNSSQARTIRPSTLKHKQNEVWYLPKGGKSKKGKEVPKLEEWKSSKDWHKDSMEEQTSISSLSLSEGFNNQGWNKLVINRFRDIKQKIKQALKESRREKRDTIVEVPLEGRSSIDGREISKRLEIIISQDGEKIDMLDEDLTRRRLQRVRRTSSLNESLERYTQLFESSFGRSEAKYSHSRSLKLTNEEKVPSQNHKSTRRNLSLPDIDYLISNLNGASLDPSRLAMSIKTNAELDSIKHGVDVDALEAAETKFQNNMVKGSESNANIEYSSDLAVDGNDANVEHLAKKESSDYQEEEIFIAENTNISSEVSQGLEFDPRCPPIEELESSVDLQNKSNTDSNIENFVTDNKNVKQYSRRFQSNITEDANYNYIRDLLDVSGFIEDEQPGTWYSLDQPLNPLLFKELESCYHQELDYYTEEVEGNCDHQLLFDLVNEILGDINEKSYTYFPRAFSFSCHIRPTPKGHHLLEDVWTKTSTYLSLRPELDQTLDDVVARDLAKGDGWMNLEWDTELVAVELEDLIFDQLLEEVLCC